MPAPVIIVDYDPRWPQEYEEERRRILAAIGPTLVAIEHVGSTAVPGLGAKPIIDIMAAVARLDDARACVAPLQHIGYTYVPAYEAELPERRYFRKGPPEGRTHHLHMVEFGSDFWQRHLRFREALRADPDAAREYERLKRALAAQYGTDRDGYTLAKTAFVESVLARPRRPQRGARG